MVVFFNPYHSNSHGPAIHAFEFIDEVRNKSGSEYVEIKFGKSIEIKDNLLILKVNNKFWTIVYSLFLLIPKESARHFSIPNLFVLIRFLSQYKYKIIYFWGFAKISFYVNFLSANKFIITMPDAQSMRYFEKLKNNLSIKVTAQFILYKFLEFRVLNKFNIVHVVAEKDKIYLNNYRAIYLPFHLSKTLNCQVEKVVGSILILYPFNASFLKLLLKGLSKNHKITKIVIQDSQNSLKSIDFINYQNVEIINWIDNYEEYTSKFQILIADDPIDSSGMSTRVTHQLFSGNIVLGNHLAYRNIETDYKNYIYNDLTDLLLKINEIICNIKVRPSKAEVNILFDRMNYNKVFYEQFKFLDDE